MSLLLQVPKADPRHMPNGWDGNYQDEAVDFDEVSLHIGVKYNDLFYLTTK